MATTKVPLSGMAGMIRQLGAAAPVAVKKGLLSGALRGVSLAQASQKRWGAFNTGRMFSNWHGEPTADGARLINYAPYGAVVERGRRPGSRFPPPDAIQLWAMRKLGLSEAEAKSAAFAIARKIARQGIKGRPVLGSITNDVIRAATEEVDRELQRALGLI